ncbi:unnamed protein product [Gongylonema pulchrum]|uniref:Uncharacterized protein n=1 Tax=Gongylonema pulchrum TaxID=637853 RepID=A0A3P6TZC6_9BILA|nr:unnamed protein product [Gongylonema pulchrum]
MERAAAAGSITEKPVTAEAFHQIELPAADPDANGIRHYHFIVEFETTKTFLFSDRPKTIELQLEAAMQCPTPIH